MHSPVQHLLRRLVVAMIEHGERDSIIMFRLDPAVRVDGVDLDHTTVTFDDVAVLLVRYGVTVHAQHVVLCCARERRGEGTERI